MNIADQLKEQAAINSKIGADKAPVFVKSNKKPDIIVKKKKAGVKK